MITIALADDHHLIREAVAVLLAEEPDFKIIAQCSNGRQLVEAVEHLRPNVAVVDISMPELNGIDACRRIRKVNRATRVITLSVFTDNVYIRDLIAAGVSGYVVKSGAAKDLVRAIRSGSRGKIFFSEEIAEKAEYLQNLNAKHGKKPDNLENPLTAKERQILQMIGEGFSSREIAEKLGISETTVKTHRNNIMGKLNVRDVAGLTRQAIRLRLVHVE